MSMLVTHRAVLSPWPAPFGLCESEYKARGQGQAGKTHVMISLGTIKILPCLHGCQKWALHCYGAEKVC